MAGEALPLHDLANVNTVLGMLYDENGVYRAAFEPSVFYNTILLDTLKFGEENQVHLKYAETINIRRGEKTAKFRRWAGMTPTLRPLKEGVPPAPDKHAYETIEVGNVFSFGRWSEYTDKVDLSIVQEVIAERSLQYGDLANQTKELYARKTWLSSPNEFYANFKDGFQELAFGDGVLLDDLRFLIARMKRMLVKSMGGKYNYVCSPEFINGLIDDPRVKQYMEVEQTTGKLWSNGEPFPMFELLFVPTMLDEFAYPDTEYPGVFELSDGKEAIRLYAISSNTIYYLDVHEDFVVDGTTKVKTYLTGYLKDGTAVDEQAQWAFPNDGDVVIGIENTQASGEPTAAKCTLRKSTISYTTDSYGNQVKSYTALVDATGDHAAVETLINSGAFMQLPVHRGILFGMEALVKLAVDGISDAPQIIVKELGSSGVSDALNQRQSVGFKVDGFGLAIKRPEAICVTYGIPKFAELSALTAQYINGDYTLMDETFPVDSTDGGYTLVVDGINMGGTPGADVVNGTGLYPVFSASTDYAIGDTVQYEGKPYVFTATHSAGAWDGSDVAIVKATLENNVLEDVNNPDDNVL